ncbi:MAG: nucleoside-triphosphatase THEP1, partial [Gammaproteobacteria bacterium]
LFKFVEKQKKQNIRIGGILQQAQFDLSGRVIGIDAVDIATNHRTSISRPAETAGVCGLDVAALVETSATIRTAISRRVDLVVVDKFGELEQKGKGLIDEILEAIVEGIPLLISMPEAALPIWQERSGGLGSVLTFDEPAFEHWWQSIR